MALKIAAAAFALLAFLLVFQNCEEYMQTPVSEEAVEASEKMKEISQEITTVVGLECSADSDCKTAAMGVALCGGPDSYLMYSNIEDSEEELLELVEQYNEQAKVITAGQAEQGMVGTCIILMPPQDLSCVDQACHSESNDLWVDTRNQVQ